MANNGQISKFGHPTTTTTSTPETAAAGPDSTSALSALALLALLALLCWSAKSSGELCVLSAAWGWLRRRYSSEISPTRPKADAATAGAAPDEDDEVIPCFQDLIFLLQVWMPQPPNQNQLPPNLMAQAGAAQEVVVNPMAMANPAAVPNQNLNQNQQGGSALLLCEIKQDQARLGLPLPARQRRLLHEQPGLLRLRGQ